MNFTFDGNISREVLENYLSRSVTAAGLYESKTLEDDLRAIREMGVKFLGRASGIWYMTMDDEEHFRLSKELADKVHAQDPEVILQSCVFEWITRRMETVEIPDYVFEAFGMEPEHRCFCLDVYRRIQRIYQQERGSGKRRGDSGSVPAGSKTVVLLPGNPIHRLWL